MGYADGLFDLTDRVVLITGGSRGLGREMAFAAAHCGADVVVASRNIDNCVATAKEIEAETGRSAMPYQVHVGRWDQLDGLVEATYERFGKVDTLINNAGMSPVYDKLTDVTEKLFDAVVNLNLKGPFRLSALVGERMVAAGRGCIINVSSTGSLRPNGGIIPYAAAKAGLNAMTEGLAQAFGPTVRVNTLMAGPYLTDVSKAWSVGDGASNNFGHLSLQRAGDPREIIGAALFLASDASSFTTGSILRADGGIPGRPGVFDMTWDFSTEPEFEKKLDWIREFVSEEVEPLEVLFPGCEFLPLNDERRKIVDPLKQQVRDQGLWAPHLGPELGGQGFGAVTLTLINEILGRSPWAPIVFGTQAPDTGNAEIIARFGTQDQKDRYLAGLLSGEIFSCFSMTEPQGGADPRVFTTRAVRDGSGEDADWVITGRKYFSSNASVASFFIVVAITDPDVPVHRGASTFLIPAGTKGLNIEATHHLVGADSHEPGHSLVHYDGVRVPSDALLGESGQGFLILQTRLAGGRLHHAMRAIGMAQRAVDMMARRAKSRFTQGSPLADKQLVQEFVADSYTELTPFRLTVLHAAWLIESGDERAARAEIAACKILASQVLKSIALRAIQVHGALGLTDQLPLVNVLLGGIALGLADGPTEAHKVNLARMLLKNYDAESPEWPSEMLDIRREAARAKYGAPIGK